jgi:hypothetical protein
MSNLAKAANVREYGKAARRGNRCQSMGQLGHGSQGIHDVIATRSTTSRTVDLLTDHDAASLLDWPRRLLIRWIRE